MGIQILLKFIIYIACTRNSTIIWLESVRSFEHHLNYLDFYFISINHYIYIYIYIYMLKEMWTSTRRPNLSPTSSHMHVNVFPSNCPFTQANPSHAHYFTWFLDYPTVLTPLNSCHYGDPKSKSFVLGDFNFVWRRDCTRTRHYYCEFVIYL